MHLSRFRPRWTVRRLMVAVAVVALGLGGWGIWQRRNHHLRLALKHRVNAVFFLAGGDPERAARHQALRRKYEYAARHPWLPVAPDPE